MKADEQHLRAGLMILVMLETRRNQAKGEGPEMIATRADAAGSLTLDIIHKLETFMLMRGNIRICFMLCIYNI
ncbi:hypothetical protein D3C75_1332210 [compost metagenome]